MVFLLHDKKILIYLAFQLAALEPDFSWIFSNFQRISIDALITVSSFNSNRSLKIQNYDLNTGSHDAISITQFFSATGLISKQ